MSDETFSPFTFVVFKRDNTNHGFAIVKSDCVDYIAVSVDAYFIDASRDYLDKTKEDIRKWPLYEEDCFGLSRKWDGCINIGEFPDHWCEDEPGAHIGFMIDASILVADVLIAEGSAEDYGNGGWDHVRCDSGMGKDMGLDVFKVDEQGGLTKVDIPWKKS